MPILSAAMQTENLRQRAEELRAQSHQAQAGIKNAAFEQLRIRPLTSVGRQLRSRIIIRKLSYDEDKVDVECRKEVEKVPSKVIRLYDISSSSLTGIALLGTAEFDPGMQLRKIATVKTSQIVAILVRDGSTAVRRIQFDVQVDRSGEVKAEQHDVRTFPHACSLCSVRAQDRQVAFVFGENLGKAAVCRFNDAFTRIDVMRNIELDTSFSLTAPLVDVLLTERLICAVDIKGDVQSYDVRSHQTSKKTSLDELIVGRASVQKDRTIVANFISSDDHRELPTVIMSGVEASTGLGVGCAGDVLYVLNAGEGAICAYELNVTVRSDAFRLQRSGNGLIPTQRGRVAGKHTADDASEHWLRALLRQDSFPLDIGIIVSPPAGTKDGDDIVAVCKKYFHKVMVDIRRLNKPLFGLDLTKSVTCRHGYQTRPVCQVLTAIISFVPVQICRAEGNLLKLLRDGKSATDTTTSKSGSALFGSNAAEIAQSIRFGLLSPLVESWNGRCVVVTSMGKQSTRKSYFLNHLTGTTFAIAGSRCTDGVWMSKGVQLPKKNPKLFRGLLLMSVKDVNMNDRQGVVDELSAKLDLISEANKAQNFLTEMYAGQLVINCTPPFGTVEYYQSMENDVLETLCQIVSLSNQPLAGFATGKAFLDCLRWYCRKSRFWTGPVWEQIRNICRSWMQKQSCREFYERDGTLHNL
uniref:VLIG-type G domain-containing protein n=1 Tax=Hyaloperonospora arabidopsidis (strain Emoy2) TaxID=559515 RepID=M4BB85_HYAAE